MASSTLLQFSCAIFLCMVVAAPHAEAAMNCGMVASNVAPCLSYLMGSAKQPPSGCCAGIKKLKNMASTPMDRRTACGCLKSAATAMKNMNYGKAAGLPKQCGVSIPYAISPKTDCSRVN
ncbi:hypothetical protein BVRB_7g157250 [Beta vulgaris subsp. vulgaris]|nr:hypothetical protein BVRB_7g157250 [Beta vulgaris subsp. vulgaris]